MAEAEEFSRAIELRPLELRSGELVEIMRRVQTQLLPGPADRWASSLMVYLDEKLQDGTPRRRHSEGLELLASIRMLGPGGPEIYVAWDELGILLTQSMDAETLRVRANSSNPALLNAALAMLERSLGPERDRVAIGASVSPAAAPRIAPPATDPKSRYGLLAFLAAVGLIAAALAAFAIWGT